MSGEMIQIIVLAAIALVLVLRLRNVLGTRGGFEKPDRPAAPKPPRGVPVPATPAIDDAAEDADIAAGATETPATEAALRAIQAAEPGFSPADFLAGARQAHEMVVTGFEGGDLSDVESFLSPDVARGFADAIANRKARNLTMEFRFIGLRDASIVHAAFDPRSRMAEVTVRFTADVISALRDAEGRIVEGDPTDIRRQVDSFTFERRAGSADPNWTLVSTGD
jgi:predicted lipid-binding transport protein (Tim44 family)